MSYAAKYASAFYGPFRNAISASNNLGPNKKKSYQMDYNNNNEALKEVSMDIKEGKYYQKTQLTLKADSSSTIQNNDLLGLGYRLRTTENLKSQIGDTIFFDYHYQDRYYKSHLKIMEEEIIKTKFGKIKALKLSPLLEKGRVFKSESGAFVWVSSDNMRIPLKIELPVLVGSIYVSLDSYQNTLFDF